MPALELILRAFGVIQLTLLATILLSTRRRDQVALVGAALAASVATFMLTSAPGAATFLGVLVYPLTTLCATHPDPASRRAPTPPRIGRQGRSNRRFNTILMDLRQAMRNVIGIGGASWWPPRTAKTRRPSRCAPQRCPDPKERLTIGGRNR